MNMTEARTENLDTLSEYLRGVRDAGGAAGIDDVVSAIGLATRAIANKVRRARIGGDIIGTAGETNVQGEEQQKLDALAAAIRWAKIDTSGFDRAVKMLVGASDLWDDIEALATAVKELLENSIDAGATAVDIRLVDHGSTLVEVPITAKTSFQLIQGD